jgi:hypothetical protein
LGARSRREKAAGLAAVALMASAPFGGLERVAEDPPRSLVTAHAIRIGPYDVTFQRAYRVKQYLGAQLEPWATMPVKPSSESRRLLVVEVDVTNAGRRPEYGHTLTKAVSIAGAEKVDNWGGPSTRPSLIYRADGSAAGVLGPGLTHRLALVVEQPAAASSQRATIRVSKVRYVGKGGLASNLDEDYWLILDDTARQGTVSISAAPAAVTR